MVNSEELYMKRAIELAQLGLGNVSPNPMVGCVIVNDDKIIGEGYHEKFGQAHAEVNAVDSVENQDLLSESAVYVTLEPCSHYGKTPPCADLLITKKVKKVVVGCSDPFNEVDGKGINKLKEAGIHVEMSSFEHECRSLNKRFFTYVEKKRPFVLLKWAQSEDGFIARENFDSKWISNQYSRQQVHQWRAEEDAIMVGKNTAIYDNPMLNVRDAVGNNPTRIVIDNKLELSAELNLFDGSVLTYVLNLKKEGASDKVNYLKYDGTIDELLARLYERQIQSVLIEGGAKTLTSFIESRLWDEARVFSSNENFEKGIEAPNIGGRLLLDDDVMGDRIEIFENVH